jgi:monoamine oxidase
MTIYDWIETYVPGGHDSPFGTLLENAYNEEYGAETIDQSALNLIYLLGYNTKPGNFSIYGKSDERYHIVGGSSKLPIAIADALPAGRLHLGYRLTAIAVNADGSITLTFDTGSGSSTSAKFDHVVLGMSFSVLRTLGYRRAGFDDLKKTAITQLGSGINAKLNMQFNSRYWNDPSLESTGSVYTDLPLQSGWDVTRGQPGATGIFVAYPGANVSKSLGQAVPYSTSVTNSQVASYASQFVAQLDKIWRASPGSTTVERSSQRRSRTRTSSAPTRTGSRGSTPGSAATRGCGRGTFTSPASTARRTSRDSWRAVRPRASALRTRSSGI